MRGRKAIVDDGQGESDFQDWEGSYVSRAAESFVRGEMSKCDVGVVWIRREQFGSVLS